ncbi:MAG: cytochrome c biogenesis protein CcdA [Bryobacteraceae bacterium]
MAPCLFAQRQDPVQWTLTADSAKVQPGASVPLRLTAKIEDGWHVYSLTQPPGGPIASTASLADNPAVEGSRIFQAKPEVKFDPSFQLNTEEFEKEANFWVVAALKKDAAPGPVELSEQLRYQACNNTICLPPRKKTATVALNVDPSAPALPAFAAPVGFAEVIPGAPSPASGPVSSQTGSDSMAVFLLTAFGVGLASIFTPCVFPMIPITVSFFLDKGGIRQALVFSLGIIVLFCSLGFGVAAAIGPFGVVQLGSNPWVNGFIALVFGIFALSLLGAFEITLPSGVLTRLDKASRRGGYAGTLLMGLTFSLTSFACIGPFVGSLLAASVQHKGAEPVLGMVTFAAGLACPFFLLAAFPSYLKKLPRSGGWLARVKVVMGFILLAAMLKYASNIDQVLQTNWLTRDRFLAAWFVLFALAGIYLLGLLRMEGVEPGESLSIGRLLVASAFLIFAFSLLPGMFGARLGDLDAYVPAVTEGGIGAQASAATGQWMKNQYREALDQARSENKLVLVTFTGYACTNCHWMKANMFPRPEVAEATKGLVLVELYTDGTDQASEENQKLEDDKFQTVAIPYYAILDPNGNPVSTFAGSTSDEKAFLNFLTKKPARPASAVAQIHQPA